MVFWIHTLELYKTNTDKFKFLLRILPDPVTFIHKRTWIKSFRNILLTNQIVRYIKSTIEFGEIWYALVAVQTRNQIQRRVRRLQYQKNSASARLGRTPRSIPKK